jgi:hypothetical protein
MDDAQLQRENGRHAGTGGRSQANGGLGFRAAFFDFATHSVYLSRFADGRIAPMHLMDGLPDEVVVIRAPSGRVIAARATLIAGFERNGYFFTRSAAARAAREWMEPRA